MPVLALGRAVLLVCIGTGNMVRDPNALKKGIQLLILTTRVGLHNNILAVKRAFNKVLKILKTLKDFRLMAKQINPSEFAEISIKLT
jgi:hypothetical protein